MGTCLQNRYNIYIYPMAMAMAYENGRLDAHRFWRYPRCSVFKSQILIIRYICSSCICRLDSSHQLSLESERRYILCRGRPPGIVGRVHERHVGLTRQPNEAALPGTVLCVGAAMREIRHYRADSGVNFYAHGSEPKDIARFVMPAFKEIISARKQTKTSFAG